MDKMQYVLVHGAWHAGWCWDPLAMLLREEGHKVSCPDLPGHGMNHFSHADVTYDTYYQSLVDEIMRYNEPVVLVAHSMSGMLAAPLLDQYPDKIKHLFLIAAYVPQNGRSLHELATSGGPSVIPSMLLIDDEEKTLKLDLDKAKSGFYHDLPQEVVEWAISRLRPQPQIPLMTAIKWVDSGKTVHKRTYIFCEDDRDVHPITQGNVLAQYPCRIMRIKEGHFPFLTNPRLIQEILQDAK